MVDHTNSGDEEVTYKSSSKDSFESVNRKHETEIHTVLATSLSSEYTTAEPFLMQQPGREILSEDRASEYRPSNGIKMLII